MMENHHPNFVGDPWAATIDAGRCASTRSGRRCQLWDDHATRDVLPTMPHAHEWRENVPDPPLTHAPTDYRQCGGFAGTTPATSARSNPAANGCRGQRWARV